MNCTLTSVAYVLPNDIWKYVFEFLTAAESAQCRRVCKRFQLLIEWIGCAWTATAHDLRPIILRAPKRDNASDTHKLTRYNHFYYPRSRCWVRLEADFETKKIEITVLSQDETELHRFPLQYAPSKPMFEVNLCTAEPDGSALEVYIELYEECCQRFLLRNYDRTSRAPELHQIDVQRTGSVTGHYVNVLQSGLYSFQTPAKITGEDQARFICYYSYRKLVVCKDKQNNELLVCELIASGGDLVQFQQVLQLPSTAIFSGEVSREWVVLYKPCSRWSALTDSYSAEYLYLNLDTLAVRSARNLLSADYRYLPHVGYHVLDCGIHVLTQTENIDAGVCKLYTEAISMHTGKLIGRRAFQIYWPTNRPTPRFVFTREQGLLIVEEFEDDIQVQPIEPRVISLEREALNTQCRTM